MDALKVSVRLRPLSDKEKSLGLSCLWSCTDRSVFQHDQSATCFYFDHVFGPQMSNGEVYDQIMKDIVAKAMEGFHGTFITYGQSGSGKTYTTDALAKLAIENLYGYIENCPTREFLLRISYIELYNERLSDLLATEECPLTIREDIGKNISIEGLVEEAICSKGDAFSHLARGNEKRRFAETKLNERSSRAHCIIRIVVESRALGDVENSSVFVSHLHLVDLAGSEKAGENVGDRFREGCSINKSLLALSQVIRKLSEGQSNTHISYRDSKLTRILQNALGGNSRTAIICTIAPSSLEESLSTLRFACNAKKVKNKPHQNEVVTDEALIKRYRSEIKHLYKRIDELETAPNSQSIELEKFRQQIDSLKSMLLVSSKEEATSRGKEDRRRRETVCVPQMYRYNRFTKMTLVTPLKPKQEKSTILESLLERSHVTESQSIQHRLESPCVTSSCDCQNLSFTDFEKTFVDEHTQVTVKKLKEEIIQLRLLLRKASPNASHVTFDQQSLQRLSPLAESSKKINEPQNSEDSEESFQDACNVSFFKKKQSWMGISNITMRRPNKFALSSVSHEQDDLADSPHTELIPEKDALQSESFSERVDNSPNDSRGQDEFNGSLLTNQSQPFMDISMMGLNQSLLLPKFSSVVHKGGEADKEEGQSPQRLFDSIETEKEFLEQFELVVNEKESLKQKVLQLEQQIKMRSSGSFVTEDLVAENIGTSERVEMHRNCNVNMTKEFEELKRMREEMKSERDEIKRRAEDLKIQEERIEMKIDSLCEKEELLEDRLDTVEAKEKEVAEKEADFLRTELEFKEKRRHFERIRDKEEDRKEEEKNKPNIRNMEDELHQAKEEVEADRRILEKQMADLKRQEDEIQKCKMEADAEQVRLEEMSRNLEKECQELNNDKFEAEQQRLKLDDLKESLQQQENSLSQRKSDLRSLDVNGEFVAQEMKIDLEVQKDILLNERKEIEEERKNVEVLKADLGTEIGKLHEERQDKTGEVQSNCEIEMIAQEKQSELMKEEIKKMRADLEAQRDALLKERQEIEEEKNNLEVQRACLEKQSFELREEKQKIEENKEIEKVTNFNSPTDAVAAVKEQLEFKSKTIEKMTIDLEQERDALQQKRQAFEEEKSKLQLMRAEFEEQILVLREEKEKDENRPRVTTYFHRSTDEMEDEAEKGKIFGGVSTHMDSNLTNNTDQIGKQNQSIRETVDMQRKENVDMSKELEELKRTREEMESEKEEIKKRAEDLQIQEERIEMKIDSLCEKEELLEDRLDTVEAKEKEVTEKEADFLRAELEFKEKRQRFERIQDEEDRKEEVKHTLDDGRIKADELHQVKPDVEADRQIFEQQITDLKRQEDEILKSKTEIETEHIRLKEMSMNLEKQREELNRDKFELEQQRAQLDLKESLQQQGDSLNQRKADLCSSDVDKNLEQELKTVKEMATDLEAQRDVLLEEREDLMEEKKNFEVVIEDLKKEIGELNKVRPKFKENKEIEELVNFNSTTDADAVEKEQLEFKRKTIEKMAIDLDQQRDTLQQERQEFEEEKSKLQLMRAEFEQQILALNDEKNVEEDRPGETTYFNITTSNKVVEGDIHREKPEAVTDLERQKLEKERRKTLEELKYGSEEQKTEIAAEKRILFEMASDLEKQKDDLQKEKEEIMDERNRLKQMMTDMEQQRAELDEKMLTFTDMCGSQSTQSKTQREDKNLIQSKMELEKQKDDILQENHEIEDKKMMFEEMMTDFENQKIDLEREKEKVGEERMKLDMMTLSLEGHKNMIEEEKMKLEILTADLARERDDLKQEKMTLEEMRTSLSKQSNEWEEEKDGIVKLRKESETYIESQRESLLKEKEMAEEETKKISVMVEDFEQWKRQLEKEKEEMEEERKQLEEMAIDLNRQNDKLQKDYDEMREEQATFKEITNNLELQRQDILAQKEELAQDEKNLEEKTRELNEMTDNFNLEKAELEAERIKFREASEALENEKDKVQRERDELEEMAAEVRRQRESCVQSQPEEATDVPQRQEDVEKIAHLERLIEKGKTFISQRNKLLGESREKNAALDVLVKELEENIRHKDKQLALTAKQYEETVDQLKAEIQRARDEDEKGSETNQRSEINALMRKVETLERKNRKMEKKNQDDLQYYSMLLDLEKQKIRQVSRGQDLGASYIDPSNASTNQEDTCTDRLQEELAQLKEVHNNLQNKCSADTAQFKEKIEHLNKEHERELAQVKAQAEAAKKQSQCTVLENMPMDPQDRLQVMARQIENLEKEKSKLDTRNHENVQYYRLIIDNYKEKLREQQTKLKEKDLGASYLEPSICSSRSEDSSIEAIQKELQQQKDLYSELQAKHAAVVSHYEEAMGRQRAEKDKDSQQSRERKPLHNVQQEQRLPSMAVSGGIVDYVVMLNKDREIKKLRRRLEKCICHSETSQG